MGVAQSHNFQFTQKQRSRIYYLPFSHTPNKIKPPEYLKTNIERIQQKLLSQQHIYRTNILNEQSHKVIILSTRRNDSSIEKDQNSPYRESNTRKLLRSITKESYIEKSNSDKKIKRKSNSVVINTKNMRRLNTSLSLKKKVSKYMKSDQKEIDKNKQSKQQNRIGNENKRLKIAKIQSEYYNSMNNSTLLQSSQFIQKNCSSKIQILVSDFIHILKIISINLQTKITYNLFKQILIKLRFISNRTLKENSQQKILVQNAWKVLIHRRKLNIITLFSFILAIYNVKLGQEYAMKYIKVVEDAIIQNKKQHSQKIKKKVIIKLPKTTQKFKREIFQTITISQKQNLYVAQFNQNQILQINSHFKRFYYNRYHYNHTTKTSINHSHITTTSIKDSTSKYQNYLSKKKSIKKMEKRNFKIGAVSYTLPSLKAEMNPSQLLQKNKNQILINDNHLMEKTVAKNLDLKNPVILNVEINIKGKVQKVQIFRDSNLNQIVNSISKKFNLLTSQQPKLLQLIEKSLQQFELNL